MDLGEVPTGLRPIAETVGAPKKTPSALALQAFLAGAAPSLPTCVAGPGADPILKDNCFDARLALASAADVASTVLGESAPVDLLIISWASGAPPHTSLTTAYALAVALAVRA